MTLATLLLALFACSGDKTSATDTGVAEGEGEGSSEGEGAAECTEDTGCADGQICEGDACVDGDRNNSADEAETIVWETDATGVLNPAGDTDYYAFAADGGEFIRIQTMLTADADLVTKKGWDSAIILRDPEGQVVASVDNYPTGARVNGYDSVLYAYLDEAGTYTVQVEDLGDFDGSRDPLGDPDYTYTIQVKQTSSHTTETDSIDDPSYSPDITADHTYYPIGVALEAAGDEDYVDIDFPWSQAGIFVIGTADMGGSLADPRARLYASDGTLLTDKDGVGPGGAAVYPAMDAEHYTLALTDGHGNGGTHYWFFVFVIVEAEGGAYQDEAEPNDDGATATAVTQYDSTTSGGDAYTYGHGQGTLDPAGDLDAWSLDGMAGGLLTICLNAINYGSSAVPSLDVYSSDGTLQDSVDGDPDASYSQGTTVIENLAVTADTYTVVVRDDAGSGGLDAWYRFVAYVTPFTATSYSCP